LLGETKFALVYTYLLHVSASCWQHLLQQGIIDELLYYLLQLQMAHLALSVALFEGRK